MNRHPRTAHLKRDAAAAMGRLRALQDPAIDRLAALIAQDLFPTVAYAACRDVLDRTLGKPREHVDLQIGATEALLARLDAWKKKHDA